LIAAVPCFQCFDCWLGGRKGIWPVKNPEWCGAGVVICLERGADLHMAQLMPLPLTVSCYSKIQIGLSVPFWYRLTQVVPDKGPLNGCVCVCECCSTGLRQVNAGSAMLSAYAGC